MLRICILLCWAATLWAQQSPSPNRPNPQTPSGGFKKLHPVKLQQLWGFIDSSGQQVIPAIYDYVGEFDRDGHCIVAKNKKLGLINLQGQDLIPCSFELLEKINNELLLVRNEQQTWELRNFQNKKLVSDVGGHVTLLQNRYFLYEKVSGYGLGHVERGLLTEANYDTLIQYPEQHCFVFTAFEGQKGVLDTLGKEILAANFKDIHCHKGWFFASNGDALWALFNRKGEQISEFEWNNLSPFNHNFVQLQKDGKWHLYSVSARKVILSGFIKVQLFSDNLVLFAKEVGKIGLADTSGKAVVAPIYNDIRPFSDSLYRVQAPGTFKWGLAPASNDSSVINTYIDFIGELSANNIATFILNGKTGVMNYKGKITLPAEYTGLSLTGNVAKIKNEKDGLSFINFDEEGNVTEETRYKNYKTLKINGINTTTAATNPTGTNSSNPRLKGNLNDSLVWMLGRNSKYGVYNVKQSRFVIEPQYDAYQNYEELGFSIAEVRHREIGGTLSLHYVGATVNSNFTIISNSVGRALTKSEFIHIEMNDFLVDSLPLARCIVIGGRYGLINKKGQFVITGMSFIDKFHEGKARCTKVGNLGIDVHGKHSRNLGNALSYIDDLMFQYEFEGINGKGDPKLRSGVLFCDDAQWGYIDTLGRWSISPTKYKFVEPFHNNRAMVCMDDKWGLIDETGKEILPTVYDDLNFIPNSGNKLYYISQFSKKLGFINNTGRIAVPVKYDKVKSFSEGLAAVCLGSAWGFVNDQEMEVIPCRFRQVNDFSEGKAAVYEKGRWGFVDKQNKLVLKPIYLQVGNFKEGMAWVQEKPGIIAYINHAGEKVFEGEYRQASDFEKGVARIKTTDNAWALIDKNGKWVMKPQANIRQIGDFNEYGLAELRIDDMYGLVNLKGEIITKTLFHQINPFSEGYAVVRLNQGSTSFYGIIDTLGNLICKPQFRQLGDVHDGLASFCGDKAWGYVNPKGEIVIEAKYFKVSDFKSGRAIVYQKYNQSGLIDTKGNYIMAPKLEKILDVSENLVLVKLSYGQYYFIQEDLQRYSSKNFQAAHRFDNGIAPVCTDNHWGIVNRQGFSMVTPKYSQIEAFKDGYAKVKMYATQGVVDESGKVLIQPEYEYVSYSGNGLFRVEQGNQVGYLNMSGAWVWEMKD